MDLHDFGERADLGDILCDYALSGAHDRMAANSVCPFAVVRSANAFRGPSRKPKRDCLVIVLGCGMYSLAVTTCPQKASFVWVHLSGRVHVLLRILQIYGRGCGSSIFRSGQAT